MEKCGNKLLENTLIPRINKLSKFFGSYNQDVFKEHGVDINKEQLIILKYLSKNEGLVQNDLAHITEKDKTTLTRLINKLEKKGLVIRVKCEDDNRCNKIFITDLGQKKFDAVFPILEANANKVQGELTEQEVKETIKVLEKLAKKVKELSDEIKIK